MRFDKLTTKFQQAVADAQSLAVKNDNPYIEPVHVLAALLADTDSGTGSLLARAGVAVNRVISDLNTAIGALPQVQGAEGNIQVSRDLQAVLTRTDKEASRRGDTYIASELFLLALVDDKGEAAASCARRGCSASRWKSPSEPCAAAKLCPTPKASPTARLWPSTPPT